MAPKVDNQRMSKKECGIWKKIKRKTGSGGSAAKTIRRIRQRRGK